MRWSVRAIAVAAVVAAGTAQAAPSHEKAVHKFGELRGQLSFCDGNHAATVYLPGTGVLGRTGPGGAFTFHFVPPGFYELVIAKEGHAPHVKSGVQVLNGRVTELGTLGLCPDADGDGATIDVDCNDNNPAIHPDAVEACGDGADNDCDGDVDEGCTTCTDGDSDAYFAQAGCGTAIDCDDGDATLNPGAQELCDGRDNDCDGDVDEDFALQSDSNNCGECGLVCGGACVAGACQAMDDADGDTYSIADGDCDDEDASVHPGVAETCDGVDNDCDGSVDAGASCNDGNECTFDVCSAGSCAFSPMPAGQLCSLGVCSGTGVCAVVP